MTIGLRRIRRVFGVADLWFFQEPKTWAEIRAQFRPAGYSEWDLTQAVIEADCDGGRGYLDWSPVAKGWYLTDAGRAHLLGSRLEGAA